MKKIKRQYRMYKDTHRTINGIVEKQCSKCSIWKPLNGFSKRATNKDGLQYTCKFCKKRYRQEHFEEIKKYWKQYCQEHAEKRRNYSKQYRQEHPEEVRECGKQYRQNHRQEIKKRQKEYYNTINGYLKHVFKGMNQRCDNPVGHALCYKDVEVRFTFDELYNWCKKNKVDPRGLVIHRKKNDKHYSLDNIEFITEAEHRAKHKQMRKRICAM